MYQRRIIGFFLLFCGYLISILLVNAAVTANWGDIVNVRASVYLDAAHTEELEQNINLSITNVYLGRGPQVPPEILESYPDADATYLLKFKEGIIGMEVDETKEFKIDSKDHAYSNLVGKDLYYIVVLLEIVYDGPDPTSTTTSNGGPPPLPDLTFLLAAGAGISLLAGGLLLRGYRTSQRLESVANDKSQRTEQQEQILKKEQSQLQELRKLAEIHSDAQDESQGKDLVKFRRRR
ncbi:MAG: hypothetical protein ACFFFG_03590 [Candidatus Thorarchaeota archaeon]